jgi:hypothetical protein
MHQASLRKKRANTCFPQAVFCQCGKLGQVKNTLICAEERQGTLPLVGVRQSEVRHNFSLPSFFVYHVKQQSGVSTKAETQRLLKCPPLKRSGNIITTTEPCFIHPKLLTGETQCRN